MIMIAMFRMMTILSACCLKVVAVKGVIVVRARGSIENRQGCNSKRKQRYSRNRKGAMR